MSPHDLLILLFGLLTGLSLGALGSGGSILALPALVYAAGLPVKSAVATSLAVVGTTSLAGAIIARRRCVTYGCPGQEVDARVAALFAGSGLLGSFAGAHLAGFLSDGAQMLLFAVVVVSAAIAMARRREAAEEIPGTVVSTAQSSRPLWLLPALGLGVGLLTGVIGVGGGFLIVPALNLLAGVPVKRAISTALWIIAANSATGMLGYVGRVPIAWGAAGLFLAASLLGMLAGQHIARRARPQPLRRAFAVFLVLVGLFTIAKTVAKPPSGSASAPNRFASQKSVPPKKTMPHAKPT